MRILFVILLAFLLAVAVGGCHVARFVYWNFANITDYKKFPSHKIAKSPQPFRFARKANQAISITTTDRKGKPAQMPLEQFLAKHHTVAFLVIRNDSIVYEKYLNGYDSTSVVTSFSVAKSFVSTLVGIAVAEGAIKSVDEPITNYLPELRKPGFEKITIRHVLDMQSGIDFNESYVNPFGDAAKYYYGLDLKKYVSQMKIKEPPGQRFDYISGNTQILGMIIERATSKPLAQYLQEKMWQPMGMEYDATWSLDSRKHQEAKAYCCINAQAVDFAKLGRLYLNKGNWNGTQLLPEAWVERAVGKEATHPVYNYQWWKGPGNEFLARGILGQIVYVVPDKNLILVRMGTSNLSLNWPAFMHDMAKNF
jgi:CubicO group peptidase (beta-lactamase class C family)